MLTIRLTRKGKKNQPFFRVVVIDKRRTASGGRAVEDLGYVNPLTKKKSFEKDRILYWISKGAKPSPSVHNLLVSEKIIDEPKIKIENITKKKKAAALLEKQASLAQEGREIAAAEQAKVVTETKPAATSPAGEASLAPEGREEPKAEPTPAIETPKQPAVAEGSGVAKEEKPAA